MQDIDPYGIPSGRMASKAPLVQHIRPEVDAWRNQGYPGTSATTRRLLEWWFEEEHESQAGLPFRYYFAQREAVETTIFLYEVAKAQYLEELSARYGVELAGDVAYPRYVVKMATGSGKTKVMSLIVAWSYLNSRLEDHSTLPSCFLMIAPNVIVYERLRDDFTSGLIFREDPVIPPEWSYIFDLKVCLKGEPLPVENSFLALSNIQALYERRDSAPASPLDAVLGRKPRPLGSQQPTLLETLSTRGPFLVLNDEAHHLHDEVKADTGEKLVAWRTLTGLHRRAGVALQFDVSATPRTQQGQLFGEIISDYPLAAAIRDEIVKRPIIGEIEGVTDSPSDDASIRYRSQLAAGVAKWREFRDVWRRANRNPLLFVMAENTRAADQISEYLETREDLGGRVLTIHTNRVGEVTAADMDRARQAVRDVDNPNSPYSAIVSVLMLREGWDVRNVTVIVPLRPFSAKAKILPEQTLGRGLRRMSPPGSGVTERLVVIEHEQFRQLWEDVFESENLDIEFEQPELIEFSPSVIAVEPDRLGLDIDVPQVPRALTRTTSGLPFLRVDDIPSRHLALDTSGEPEEVQFTGRDMLSGEVVERATYPYPRTGTREAVLAWYVEMIQRDAQLTGQFHLVAPLLRDWVESRAFGRRVSFDNENVIRALAEPTTQEQIRAAFRQAIDTVSYQNRVDPVLDVKTAPLSATRPFLWSGEVYVAKRSVFSGQPCDNGFELSFCRFLDRATDVASFAKLAREMRFSLEYRNDEGRLAYYYPDFVARVDDQHHFVIETKGLVDVDVAIKDSRAQRWAQEATYSTGVEWSYMRVDESLYYENQDKLTSLGSLHRLVKSRRRSRLLAELPSPRRSTPSELRELMERSLERSAGTTGIDELIDALRSEPRG